MADCPPPVPLSHDEAKEFLELVMEDKWGLVIQKYKDDIRYQNINMTGKGTALHVAISNGCIDVVSSLVEAILNRSNKKCLEIKNGRGDTPLHLAAYRGFTDICELIIGKEAERKYLIQIENVKQETPLFCAVLGDKKIVFDYLQELCPLDLNIAFDENGTSILHLAIEREMFDLANRILFCYEWLGYSKDKNGVTPLEILATKTSAFKSGNTLSWWKEILYYCFSISLHDATTNVEFNQPKEKSKETVLPMELNQQKEKSQKNAKIEKSSSQVNITLNNVEKLEREYKIRDSLAQSCCRIQQFLFKCPIQPLLDLKVAIKTIKMNHKLGHELLIKLMEKPTSAYMGAGENPKQDAMQYDGIEDAMQYDGEEDESQKFKKFIQAKRGGGDALMRETKENKKIEDSANITGKDSTFFAFPKSGKLEIKEVPNSDKKDVLLLEITNINREVKIDVKNTSYLIAASHGIIEIMSMLESKIKSVIYETNSNNENVLLLAVKYRQARVIERLWETLPSRVFYLLTQQVDKNGNTMLHLAANTSFQREHSWMISGDALQMMWDIKWYKYIKELVPKHFNNRENKQGKTPSEIFKEQREDLLQKSIEWLKETIASCSVVASLIAGVAFATIGSVPGGNKETGEPALEGKPAFEGFAISSLIGLYFSVTALMMFLAILTSRKEIADFRKTVPMKLLFGLSSLFVSIVAMFVSFSAGHFSILTDKYTKGGILFYLYVFICLSVALYAAVQFTLLVDLFHVISKKVPPPTVKGVHL